MSINLFNKYRQKYRQIDLPKNSQALFPDIVENAASLHY